MLGATCDNARREPARTKRGSRRSPRGKRPPAPGRSRSDGSAGPMPVLVYEQGSALRLGKDVRRTAGRSRAWLCCWHLPAACRLAGPSRCPGVRWPRDNWWRAGFAGRAHPSPAVGVGWQPCGPTGVVSVACTASGWRVRSAHDGGLPKGSSSWASRQRACS